MAPQESAPPSPIRFRDDPPPVLKSDGHDARLLKRRTQLEQRTRIAQPRSFRCPHPPRLLHFAGRRSERACRCSAARKNRRREQRNLFLFASFAAGRGRNTERGGPLGTAAYTKKTKPSTWCPGKDTAQNSVQGRRRDTATLATARSKRTLAPGGRNPRACEHAPYGRFPLCFRSRCSRL